MIGTNLTDSQKRERRIENLMHDDFGGLTYILAAGVIDGNITMAQAIELMAL